MRRTKTLAILLITAMLLLTLSYIAVEKVYGQNLYWGSRGDDVREVQTRLQRWGYYDGPISSVYGPQTFEAVKDFQRANGLTVDGVVGPQTRAALGMPVQTTAPAAPASQGVSRSDDINLLARTIHAEAKGEPYEGKVAVGAVILNRVRNPAFPNTMAGVVYQPCAFEPVKRGTINEAPDDDAFRAARDALNGWDPTGGAIYFWNPATATSPWIWTRQISLRIGRHVFAH
ncbi:spore cortex-lytic enzyme [Alkaliphilus peptidifermentans]|uniref:Spore cortex-lytic enzyme n=1 Tax=Alkaliphilus peptidifermentans DSM 18978 TaxID=1120976 RepID=A0A1G5HZQ5_9FIRM|nr:spore cortex-lytic enzyme [Alkaliphilus peptidifermentans]SCY69181.1 N-acetylmuramoyl-L-alanine amidase [Alkaliphilus peptidifermentans DSM 18978]